VLEHDARDVAEPPHPSRVAEVQRQRSERDDAGGGERPAARLSDGSFR
jgi:hypothetical protein